MLEDELTTRLTWEASATANYIDSVQLSVQSTAKSIEAAIENARPDELSREDVLVLLEATVASNEAVWGMTVEAIHRPIPSARFPGLPTCIAKTTGWCATTTPACSSRCSAQ
jgi:hypothetical protein